VVYDSVILIDALNGNRSAQQRLLTDQQRIICAITRTEVLSKPMDDTEAARTRAFLDGFVCQDVTPAVADLAATLRQGTRLKTPDALIYATAKLLGTTLVTRDQGFPAATDIEQVSD
jgi:predicted nucleic acid-binding protein